MGHITLAFSLKNICELTATDAETRAHAETVLSQIASLAACCSGDWFARNLSALQVWGLRADGSEKGFDLSKFLHDKKGNCLEITALLQFARLNGIHGDTVTETKEVIIPTENFWRQEVAAQHPESSKEVRLAWQVSLQAKDDKESHFSNIFLDSETGEVLHYGPFR